MAEPYYPGIPTTRQNTRITSLTDADLRGRIPLTKTIMSEEPPEGAFDWASFDKRLQQLKADIEGADPMLDQELVKRMERVTPGPAPRSAFQRLGETAGAVGAATAPMALTPFSPLASPVAAGGLGIKALQELIDPYEPGGESRGEGLLGAALTVLPYARQSLKALRGAAKAPSRLPSLQGLTSASESRLGGLGEDLAGEVRAQAGPVAPRGPVSPVVGSARTVPTRGLSPGEEAGVQKLDEILAAYGDEPPLLNPLGHGTWQEPSLQSLLPPERLSALEALAAIDEPSRRSVMFGGIGPRKPSGPQFPSNKTTRIKRGR